MSKLVKGDLVQIKSEYKDAPWLDDVYGKLGIVMRVDAWRLTDLLIIYWQGVARCDTMAVGYLERAND